MGPQEWPTRSPYWIAEDEGPQSIAELKAALADWPQELQAFVARLETARFEELRDLVAEYRMVWLARAHPAIQDAIEASQDGPSADAVPAESVWAAYDPETLEALPDAAAGAAR
ncbi:hypothetical protein [Streptomyces mayteni]